MQAPFPIQKNRKTKSMETLVTGSREFSHNIFDLSIQIGFARKQLCANADWLSVTHIYITGS